MLEKTIQTLSKLDDTPVFCDTESPTLYAEPRLIQVYQPSTMKKVLIIDCDLVDYTMVAKLLEKHHTVWWGANYDLAVLDIIPDKVDDMQLLMRTAHPELGKYKLDFVTTALVGNLYKDIDKNKLQKQGFKRGVELTEEQLFYAAIDVKALAIMWNDPALQQVRELPFYKLDMEVLKYTLIFQKNGAIVDIEGVQKELDKIPSKLEEEEKVLKGVNSKSPKQVKEAFARLLGYTPDKTDKEFLISIINTTTGEVHDLAKAIYDNRRTRLRKTNLEKLLHNKVYTHFNPYGTVTGRFSSSGDGLETGINFQNVTRDMQYLLEQDTEDTVVIHLDYSTAELRAGCSIMGDATMYQYLKKGVDLHKVSATLADPEITSLDEVTKEQRQKGKAVSFGFIFGMSAVRFKEYAFTEYGISFTDEEAKEVRLNYLRKYKQIAQYHRYWWENYKTKYVVSPLGRKNKPRLGTDAINFATQSAIGETCKLAIHYGARYIPNFLDYLYMQVHDALVLRVPRGMEQEIANKTKDVMIKAWKEITKTSIFKYKDIPMGVEYSYGDVTKEVFE